MLKVGEPSLRARGVCSREILVLIMEARCTMIMEPALELTACAKEIPHKTFMWIMEIAISVLTVRDYNIFIGEFGLFRDELGGGGDPADTSRSDLSFFLLIV